MIIVRCSRRRVMSVNEFWSDSISPRNIFAVECLQMLRHLAVVHVFSEEVGRVFLNVDFQQMDLVRTDLSRCTWL